MTTVNTSRTLPSGNRLAIVATTECGYFSVTATEYEGRRDVAGGCIHDAVVVACPWLSPIVALHLSDAQTGQPMHAEANGWYWVAGALGGLGQAHHGSNDGRHTVADCERIVAEHLRVSLHKAYRVITAMQAVAEAQGPKAARAAFAAYVAAQAPRWAQEAADGRALLESKAAQYANAGLPSA